MEQCEMEQWEDVRDVAEIVCEQRLYNGDPDTEIRRLVLKPDREFQVGYWTNAIDEHGTWISKGSLLYDKPIPLSREEWVGAAKHELGRLRRVKVTVYCEEHPPVWWLAFAYGGRFGFEFGRLDLANGEVSMGLFALHSFLRDISDISKWAQEDGLPKMRVRCSIAEDGADRRHRLVRSIIRQQIAEQDNVKYS